jgi:hypothetical protein
MGVDTEYAPSRVILQISSVAIPAVSLRNTWRTPGATKSQHIKIARGLESVLPLQRPFVAYVEVTTISVWRSEKAFARFSASQPSFGSANNEYGGVHFEPASTRW